MKHSNDSNGAPLIPNAMPAQSLPLHSLPAATDTTAENGESVPADTPGGTSPLSSDDSQLSKPTVDDLRKLIDQTNRLDPTPEDRRALKRFLHDNPDVVERFGGSHYPVRFAAMAGFGGINNAPLEELINNDARRLRIELGIEAATPIERVLIENAVTAWIVLQVTEWWCSSSEGGEKSNLRHALYWDRKRTSAHKRFNRAIMTLARVRNLHPTVLQVNVGQNQVNVVR